jgi:hypothetical protein
MTRAWRRSMAVMLVLVAAVNVYLAFWIGFAPGNLTAAIVCVGCAVLIWRVR